MVIAMRASAKWRQWAKNLPKDGPMLAQCEPRKTAGLRLVANVLNYLEARAGVEPTYTDLQSVSYGIFLALIGMQGRL